jgi:hypothetical protein
MRAPLLNIFKHLFKIESKLPEGVQKLSLLVIPAHCFAGALRKGEKAGMTEKGGNEEFLNTLKLPILR